MIQAPTHTGKYFHRSFDWQIAILPHALTMLIGSRVPFFDFMSLLHAILPEAISVGWQED